MQYHPNDELINIIMQVLFKLLFLIGTKKPVLLEPPPPIDHETAEVAGSTDAVPEGLQNCNP